MEHHEQKNRESFSIQAAIITGAVLISVSVLLAGSSGNNNAPTIPENEETIVLRPVDNTDYVRGNKNAEVTLVEYSDLECPYCARFHPTVQQVLSTYGNKVRFVYRHYPLTSIHPNAFSYARATECAGSLGGNEKFFGMIDSIFANIETLSKERLGSLAAEIGLNKTTFESCLDSTTFDSKINGHITEGSTAGVSGTPSSFIIDKKGKIFPISGAVSFEALKTSIDQALAGNL
jgi:protein-disulfide isomerase